MGMKCNVRSFRFSDEVAGILETFPGDNLNAKFENMVLHCFWERQRIESQLTAKRREFDSLCEQLREARAKLADYERLEADKRKLSSALTQLTLQVFDYKEHFEAVTQVDAAAAGQASETCVIT